MRKEIPTLINRPNSFWWARFIEANNKLGPWTIIGWEDTAWFALGIGGNGFSDKDFVFGPQLPTEPENQDNTIVEEV